MRKPRKIKTYVRKSRIGDDVEWVVRVVGLHGDMALCGCPAKWEADLVRQCIGEAINNPNKSVRLSMQVAELLQCV